MRKIISILLALTMLFSCGMVAMAEEAAAPAVGVEEIDFLAKLGIMDADADPEGTITRAEMAKIVMMCIGQGATVAPTDTPFTDVNSSNEYSGYIQLANSAGIMVGTGNGKFDPNGDVTYNQVVKLLTHAIGHEAFAQASGGYPGGYLITANNNEMLVGTTPAGEQAVSHGVAAILIKNALDIDIYERVSYGDSYEYVSKAGVTALTKYFDVYEFQGVITATHFASLSGTANLKEDEIILDGATILKTGESGAEDFLGYLVNLYVKVDENARYNTVVAAYPQDNAITVVDGADVMNRTTETLLVYLDEAGEEEEIKIDVNADMIFNGSPKFWSAADLKGNFGDITTIDNDGDGDVDVLIVYNYKNVIVKSVKMSENTVFTKGETDSDWQSIVIDPESTSVKTTFVNTDGEDVTVEDLEEFNVISIARSENKDVIKAILCDETVEGSMESFGDDTITIDGTEYKYDTTKVTTPSQTDFDREGIFYLDFAGRIAFVDFEKSVNGMEYAYLKSIGAFGSGFGRKAEVQILTSEGLVVYELADEVKVNGTPMDDEVAASSVTPEQLIMYKMNDEDKITAIDTASNGSLLPEEQRLEQFTFDSEITSTFYYWKDREPEIQGKYFITADTKIFIVPNATEVATATEDDYFIIPASKMSNSTNTRYDGAKIYNVNEDNEIGALVLDYMQDAYFITVSPRGIITKVTPALNEEDEVITRISLVNENGLAITLDVENDFAVSTHARTLTDIDTEDPSLVNGTAMNATIPVTALKPGDFIRYSTMPNGPMEKIQLVWRLGNMPVDENGAVEETEHRFDSTAVIDAVDWNVDYYVGYTTVDKVINKGVIVTFEKTDAEGFPITLERAWDLSSATKLYSYNVAEKELEQITRDELSEGDTLVFVTVSGNKIAVRID